MAVGWEDLTWRCVDPLLAELDCLLMVGLQYSG